MTPYRVPKRQTAGDLMQDLQSWRNFGVEKDARQTHPWQCQATTKRGTPCGNVGAFMCEGLRYCQAHRVAGAERR